MSLRRNVLIGVAGATSARKTTKGCESEERRYSASHSQHGVVVQGDLLTKLFEMILHSLIFHLGLGGIEKLVQELLMKRPVRTTLDHHHVLQVSVGHVLIHLAQVVHQRRVVQLDSGLWVLGQQQLTSEKCRRCYIMLTESAFSGALCASHKIYLMNSSASFTPSSC